MGQAHRRAPSPIMGQGLPGTLKPDPRNKQISVILHEFDAKRGGQPRLQPDLLHIQDKQPRQAWIESDPAKAARVGSNGTVTSPSALFPPDVRLSRIRRSREMCLMLLFLELIFKLISILILRAKSKSIFSCTLHDVSLRNAAMNFIAISPRK